MKTKIKKIIIASLLSLPMISNAQFLTNPPFFNYIRTDYPATMQKVGIGNFQNNASVQSKLHVNQFLLAANPATNGLMFRTDGINNTDNIWSMFTGANNNSLTEKFRLYVLAEDSTVVIQASRAEMILANNKTQITITELKTMQDKIALLEQRIAQLENLLTEK